MHDEAYKPELASIWRRGAAAEPFLFVMGRLSSRGRPRLGVS